MNRLVCVVGLLILALVNRSVVAQDAMAEFRTPEYFANRGKPADFIPYAYEFLQANPRDPRAARIWFDICMTATAIDNKAAADEAKTQLLMEHPQSLPTIFLFKTLEDDDVRKLLISRFELRTQTLDRSTLFRFNRALEACQKHYGPAGDDTFNAQAAIASNNPEIAKAHRAMIKKDDSDLARIVDVALNAELSAANKVIRLQEWRDVNTARAYQAYLYQEELSDEERKLPSIEILMVENMLVNYQFADALPRLKILRAELDQPKVYYWQATAEAATGDTEAALFTLDELRQKFPTSDWAKTSRRLTAAFSTIEESLLEHQTLIKKVHETFVDLPLEVLELDLRIKNENAQAFEAYVAMDLKKDTLELVVKRDEKSILGYRAVTKYSQFFLYGEKKISRFEQNGVCPVFHFAVTPRAGGGFLLGFNCNVSLQGQFGMHQSVRKIVRQPLLQSARSREAFMRHALQSGSFPEAVVTQEGISILRWIRPNFDSAELASFELGIASDNHLKYVGSEAWSIKNIQYGGSDVKLSVQKWPEMPVETSAEMSRSDLMRLVAGVCTLFEESKEEAFDADINKETK